MDAVVLLTEICTGFNADRVSKAMDRMRQYRHRASQQRLESFFTLSTPTKSSDTSSSSSSSKDSKKQPAPPSKKRNMGMSVKSYQINIKYPYCLALAEDYLPEAPCLTTNIACLSFEMLC
jgi:hypothetical protein